MLELESSEDDSSLPTDRTSLVEKNELNDMSAEFEAALRKRYFSLVRPIQAFLSDPINSEYKASYQEAADEFNLKIISKREDHGTFDALFNYLTDLLINRSGTLKSNKRLTRAMLYYMYWNCDIGRNKNDPTI